jgi:type VI secretion system secreted protein Hcp
VDAYLTIEGTSQGKFKGEVSRAGAPADSIHLLSVAREPAATGLATGRRSHGVITIVREVDAASPKFAQALATNEVLKQVVITFHTSGAGSGKDAQQIELTNATITGIRKSGNTETITLDYPTIAVTWVNGGKAATDDWSVPK